MRRSVVIGSIALTLWGLILCAGVALYVNYDPRQLAELAAERFAASLGLNCRINRLTFGVFPGIHVRMEDLVLELPHASRFEARAATVYMGWSSLLRWRIIPGQIDLDTPSLMWNAPPATPVAQHAVPPQPAPFLGLTDAIASLPPDIYDALRGLRIRINNGQFLYTAAGPNVPAQGGAEHGVYGQGLHGSLRLPGIFSGSATLELKELRLSRLSDPAPEAHPAPPAGMTVQDIRLWINGLSLPDAISPTLMLDNLEVGGMLQVAGIGHATLHGELVMDDPERGPHGRFRLDGELHDATSPIPVALELPFILADTATLLLNAAHLTMDQDAATFTGQLNLGQFRLQNGLLPVPEAPLSPAAAQPSTQPLAEPLAEPLALPALTGTLDIQHLSLPRWFEFARDLPGGIERALDTLTGTLEMVLTPRSLHVPHLTATLRGIPFTGSGGVPNFAKPEIRLEGHTPAVDINAVLPELVGRAPGPLPWTSPAPVTTDPHSEGPDYNIHLTADKATAWKFDIGRFDFRCTPVPGGARLNIDAGNFYSGTLTSVTDITNAISLTVNLDKVAADKPVTVITGAPLLGGTAQVRATLTSRKDSFDLFLASLGGTIQAQVTSGYLGRRIDGRQTTFEALTLHSKMSGAGLDGKKLPPRLSYSGIWNADLRTRNLESHLRLDGALLFDSQTFAFAGIPEAPGRILWSGWGFSGDLRGQFGIDLGKDVLTLRQGEGRIDGGTIALSLTGHDFSGYTKWKGSLNATTTALGRILQHNGLLPTDIPAGTFQYMQLSTDAVLTDSTLSLDKLTGRLDDTTFSGSIQRDEAAPHVWQTNLELGTLNVSRYLPTRTPAQSAQTAQPWPLDLLNTITAKGTISLQSLTIAKLILRAVHIPFVIEKRRLTAPFAYTPYGGRGEGDLEITAEPHGYRTRLRYASSDVDAARFSHEGGFKTILGGKGKMFADVTGLLTRGSDIPAALSGNWSVELRSGSISELDSAAKPMPFNIISASGMMRDGVLNTKNITLHSPSMNARGVGDINLVNWTLDCRLHVSTQTFTNVPVTYTGSLNAPERSVNPLNAVAGAIGKLGSGLFGLVGDILSVPFKLIK